MTFNFTILAVENVYLSSLSAMRDVLQLANHIIAQQEQKGRLSSQPTLQYNQVSVDGQPVKTACGLILPVDGSLSSVSNTDVIYIPSIFTGHNIEHYLDAQKKDIFKISSWLKKHKQQGAILASVATASLIVAETGFLNHTKVPIPWTLERFLHHRYPGITPDRHQEILIANGIYCAANIGSSLPLAIKIISRYAPEAVTGLLDQYIRPMELLLKSPDESSNSTTDPLVIRAQSHIQQRFTQSIDFARLASELAVSQRTLIRHFKQTLNITPQRYQQQLRIEAAQHLMKVTQLPVSMIAAEVGYTNTPFFCRLFEERVGISVQDYRQQQRKSG